MKKHLHLSIALMALLALSLTACGVVTIVGNGDVIVETRDVRDFDRISVSGVGIVNVTIDDDTSLTIRAESNIMDVLTSDVEDNTLQLGQRPSTSINPREVLVYQITVPELEMIEVSGAATFNLPELETDNFRIEISGAGEVNIDSLVADELEIEISGAGEVQINGGSVEDLTIESSGASNVDTADLQAENADVQLTGAGEVTVRVSDDLRGRLSGAGVLNYYGNPTTDVDTSGAGSVQRIDE